MRIPDKQKNTDQEGIEPRHQTKVLFCIDSLDGGGAEKLLVDILNRMDYAHFMVDLLVLTHRGVYFNAIPQEVNWFTLTNPKHLARDYDVEVAFLEGSATAYVAGLKSRAFKVAWVHIDMYHFHWTTPFFDGDAAEATCYGKYDRIVFVSQEVQSWFNRLFQRLSLSKQEVILNFVDANQVLSRAALYPVEKTKFTFCSMGRLASQKGFDRLIPLLGALKQESLDFEYWILGAGEQEEELLALIESNQLKDVVQLKGFQENPYPYIEAADVFVSSSRVEGCPLAIGEALCLGKPIVATRCCGVTELLGHGRYGLLVENEDAALYEGLRQIATDEELRRQLEQDAKEGASRLTPSKAMDEIETLLMIAGKEAREGKSNVSCIHLTLENYFPTLSMARPVYKLGNQNVEVGHPTMERIINLYSLDQEHPGYGWKEKADELLDNLMDGLDTSLPLRITDGLLGIACGIVYLIRKGWVTGDEDEVLLDVDAFIKSAFYERLHWEEDDIRDILYYIRLRLSNTSTLRNDAPALLYQLLIHYLSLLRERTFIGKPLLMEVEECCCLGLCPSMTKRILDQQIELPLPPVTFVIPLRVDSAERAQNLDIVLELLSVRPATEILILEADKRPAYQLKKAYPQVRYEFVEDADPIFHRTKYLNRLIREATTPIVGVWDTDVIVPHGQIAEAIYAIQTDKAVMAFPYDGAFYSLSKERSERVRGEISAGVAPSMLPVMSPPLSITFHSVGGAFLIDKEKYLQAGGENERFYGWGAEDLERVQRMNVLNLLVYRSRGCLYHLYHPRMENSWYGSEEAQRQGEEELMRLCRMSEEKLI
jgi:glycosyltransferase involved in cell wall biosynthesis